MTAQDSTAAMRCIIDTDTASDDAVALLIAALSERVEIRAITTVAGNVYIHQATRNALVTLEIAVRTTCPCTSDAADRWSAPTRAHRMCTAKTA